MAKILNFRARNSMSYVHYKLVPQKVHNPVLKSYWAVHLLAEDKHSMNIQEETTMACSA